MSSDFDWSSFSTIVSNYNNPDPTLRHKSEQHISSLRNNSFGDTCLLLLNLTSLPEISVTTKEIALVLLRKIINLDSKDKWENMSDITKSTLKKTILELLIKEPNENLKNKYINVIEEIVDNTADFDEKWSELVELSVNIDKYDISNKEQQPIINSLLKVMIASMGFLFESLENEYGRLALYFEKVFKECKEMSIKVKVCKLISELMSYGEKEENDKFEPFVLKMLSTTLECFNTLDEKNLIEMMEMIIEMSMYDSNSFKKYFNDIMELVSQITSKNNYTVLNCQKIRELGFDVIVEIVEEIPSLFHENEPLLKTFLNNLYMYALETNDQENNNDTYKEWAFPTASSYSNVKTIFEDNVRFVYSIIDRLDSSLNPSYFIGVLSELITNLINKDNDYWKYIGLLSLSQVMCYAEEMSYVEKIFPFIFSMLNNTNAKLRFASAYCIDEMSSSFKPQFQVKYADKLLPHLLSFLCNENIVRVQCAQINAITSFITETSDEISAISNQLNNYFKTMITLYKKNDICGIMTKMEILISINEIVLFIEGNCKPIAKELLGYLIMYFDEYYKNKVNVMLLPKLLNCITTIGKYETEIIDKIVPQIMECVMEFINSIHKNVNNIHKDIRMIIENIINTVYNKYNHQIPKLIEMIFKLISGVNMQKGNDNEENDGNDNNASSSTGESEDLADCIKLLKSVMDVLEDKYAPFVNETEKIVLNILNKTTFRLLKVHCVEILASIIKVKYSTNQIDDIKSKSQEYITIIKTLIDKEIQFTKIRKLYVSLGEIIDKASNMYDKADLESLTGILVEKLGKAQQNFLDLVKKVNIRENKLSEQSANAEIEKDDDDETDSFKAIYTDQINEVSILQINIIECIENILKGNNNAPLIENTNKYYNIFITLSQQIIPTLYNSIEQQPLLKKHCDNYHLTTLLIDCIFENFLIEFQYQHIIEIFLKYLIELSTHSRHDIRQAAIYGIGMFIKKSPNELYEQVANILYEKIVYVINQPHNKRGEILAYENGVAALGKGIMYKNFTNKKEYILMWINHLPISLDTSEINEQNEILAQFIIKEKYKQIFNTQEDYIQFIYCLVKCYNNYVNLNQAIISLFKYAKDNNQELRNVIDIIYQREQNDSFIKTKIETIMNIINS